MLWTKLIFSNLIYLAESSVREEDSLRYLGYAVKLMKKNMEKEKLSK